MSAKLDFLVLIGRLLDSIWIRDSFVRELEVAAAAGYY